MKSATIILVIFFISPFLLYSQEKEKIDSISLLLEKASNKEKPLLYYNLSELYLTINPNKSIQISDSALKLAKENHEPLAEAMSLLNIGRAKNLLGEYNQSLDYLLLCASKFQLLNNRLFLAYTYNELGRTNEYLTNYQISLEYILKALKIFEDLNDKKGIADANKTIGNIYLSLDDYSLAISYYLKALPLYTEINYKNGISVIYNNLAICYQYQKKYDDAIEFYTKSIKIDSARSDFLSISRTYNNVGELYLVQGLFDKAHRYYELVLEICEENSNKDILSNSYVGLAQVYLHEKKYSKAIGYLEYSYRIAQEIGTRELILQCNQIFSKIYQQKGDYKRAYEFHLLSEQVADSLQNEQIKLNMLSMQMQYEFDKKQRQQEIEQTWKDAEQKSRLEKQKIISILLFVGFGFMIVLSLVIFRGYRNKQRVIRFILKNKELIAQQNELLQQKNEEITSQNAELYKHRNHLEELIEKRTSELEIAKLRAEESDELKTAFLNNISHEVRTPLNAIAGFSKLLIKPNQPAEKLNLFSKLITDSTNKLVNIITDVIAISHIHTNQIQPYYSEFELVPFVKTIVNKFTDVAQTKGINLVLNLDVCSNECKISSDNEKLERILFHLISNALKFTVKGFISVFCSVKKEALHFCVSDSGIGIAKDMQSIIFEPFRQVESGASRNYDGSGLGLAIVKAYIDALKGNVLLQSEPGKGTSVNFTIPLKKTDCLSDYSTKQITERIKTILVAEDEYSNHLYMSELLSDTDLTLIYAEDGQQAIDICKENKDIDLILMDIKMPVVDGFIAAKKIKEFRPQVIIIAQSAYTFQQYKDEHKDNVFDDYIAKPIDEDEFMKKLVKYASLNVNKNDRI